MVWVTDFPVRRMLLSEIAGFEHAHRGMRLDIMSSSGTRALGPLLGGTLCAIWAPVVRSSPQPCVTEARRSHVFGAKHFIALYFMLLSPFFLLFTMGAILAIRQKWSVFFKPVSLVGVALVFLLVTGPSTWIYQTGVPHHHHLQVMNWVDSNVSDDARIGTI